jgi:hypothetical protein
MATGPPLDEVYLEDLNDFVGMLVRLGRAVPASKWVEDLVLEARMQNLDSVVSC